MTPRRPSAEGPQANVAAAPPSPPPPEGGGRGSMAAIFNAFVYASLLFLVLYLVRKGFLRAPSVRSWTAFGLSIAALTGGFGASVAAWRAMLGTSSLRCGFRDALASMGLSVFGKYIPGKLWLLLGRAAYVGERRRFGLAASSMLSLNEQLLGLWAGLLLGALGLLRFGGLRVLGTFVVATWLALTWLVLSPWMRRTVEFLARRLLRRELRLPVTSLGANARVLAPVLGYWVLWSVGFYLLVVALSGRAMDPAVGAGFPLAASLGVLALVAPGGLGVREGVIVAYLGLAGIPAMEATTISIASRLWFLGGELIFFAAGAIAHRGWRGRARG